MWLQYWGPSSFSLRHNLFPLVGGSTDFSLSSGDSFPFFVGHSSVLSTKKPLAPPPGTLPLCYPSLFFLGGPVGRIPPFFFFLDMDDCTASIPPMTRWARGGRTFIGTDPPPFPPSLFAIVSGTTFFFSPLLPKENKCSVNRGTRRFYIPLSLSVNQSACLLFPLLEVVEVTINEWVEESTFSFFFPPFPWVHNNFWIYGFDPPSLCTLDGLP